MFCNQCGKEINNNSKFCQFCGASVSDVIPNNFDLSKMIKKAKCVTEYLDETFVENMDTIKFGRYPQNDKSGKKLEDLEWLVLEKQDDKALLICKNIIDQVPYFYPINGEECDAKIEESCWKNSFVRKYLNNEFLFKAFSDEEISFLIDSDIKSTMYKNRDWIKYANLDEILKLYPNRKINKNNFNDDKIIDITKDKIFLINYDEYITYFGMEKIVWCNKNNDWEKKTQNNKASAMYTKYCDNSNGLYTVRNALETKYDEKKHYDKFLYTGCKTAKQTIEDISDRACWLLNSVDWSIKIHDNDETSFESYRRPIFVDTCGNVDRGNPGCADGYGLRPAVWIKI